MKKKVINLFLILFLTAGFRIADCYSAWTYMYDAATEEYNSNLARCESAWSQARCLSEADAVYSQALDFASDVYYNCLGN